MRLGFHRYIKAWYFTPGRCRLPPGVYDEIMIGDYPESGGTKGEFAIRWVGVGSVLAPRIEMYNDAWKLLARKELTNLLSALDSDKYGEITADGMERLLKEAGFVDLTCYHNKKESGVL